MSSESPAEPNRAPYYLTLALLILAIGVVVGTWLFPQRASHTTSPVESGATESAHPSPVLTPDSDAKGTGAVDDTSVRDAVEFPSEQPAPQVATLTARFFEYDGTRKVGVPGLEVVILEEGAGSEETTDALYTDDQGRVVKRVPSDLQVRIVLQSPSWHFASRAGETSKSVYVTGVSADVELWVERISVFAVDVQYEDGRRYSGLVFVSPDSGPPRQFLISEDEPVILSLPSRYAWTLHASSRRPGFAAGSIELNADSPGEPRTLVLRRSDATAGVFEIVCADYPEDALVDIRISRKGDWVSGETSDEVTDWPARVPYTSKTLSSDTYNIKVEVSRHTRTSESRMGHEVADLRAGQTQSVRVRLAPPGGVRVIIVSEDGLPISKARLALANADYFNWDWARNHPPGYQSPGSDPYSLSDDDGVALLSGLPPGPLEVICDAEGYAQSRLEASVVPGREYDLGTVVLPKAQGSILIHILHPEAAKDDEYEVTLLKPLAGIVRRAERFVGKSHKITGLNLLTYVVSIRYLAGGYGAFSRQVTLSNESPQATVTFKMQKPPLKRDDE